ncbi:hypothetical protein GDO78_000182 [Eleutherodactylus coqui]|uniref:Uncharacterized protein n=1 Tax=Eleutherodactylus coqui TaxID=57060 RepID=A0A8J6FPI3_ELECQ|nr:hypothetical protein GDO78_000182 [Eleutherodactylus coqui]
MNGIYYKCLDRLDALLASRTLVLVSTFPGKRLMSMFGHSLNGRCVNDQVDLETAIMEKPFKCTYVPDSSFLKMVTKVYFRSSPGYKAPY